MLYVWDGKLKERSRDGEDVVRLDEERGVREGGAFCVALPRVRASEEDVVGSHSVAGKLGCDDRRQGGAKPPLLCVDLDDRAVREHPSKGCPIHHRVDKGHCVAHRGIDAVRGGEEGGGRGGKASRVWQLWL